MFKKLLKKNADLVIEKPKLVLLVAFIITILAGFMASSLSMDLNWVSLAPKENPAVQEYQEIIEEFPTLNSIIVLVETDERELLESVANEVVKEIGALDEYVTSVGAGVDKDFMLKNGLLYLSDEEIEMMGYIFLDPNIDKIYEMMYLNLSETIKKIEDDDITNEELQYNVATFDAMSSLLLNTQEGIKGNIDEDAIKNSLESFFTGSRLMTSPDGKMTMLTIQANFDIMDMEKVVPGVNAIEDALKQIDAQYDNVSVKATGMHIVARDEMASIQSDSYITTILSLILILTVLYFAFRSFFAPAFAFIPLLLGIIWSMGFAGLTVGRLNMMTVFSAAMLLGLGIDYAIHMYSSYTEKRSSGSNKQTSIISAITETGPSIIVGALTTALAFFALNISSLEILSELGTVMGTGIITTLISVFWVLPSLIMLKKEKDTTMKKIKGNYPFIGAIAKGVYKVKYLVLIVVVGLAVFMGYQAKNVQFDMNLLNLEPKGLESVELMEYMVEKYDTSADSFAIQVDSLDKVYQLHDAFQDVDGVSEVVSIASVIPKEQVQKEKLKTIEDVKEALAYQAEFRTVDKTVLKMSVDALKQELENYKEVFLDSDLGILDEEDFTAMIIDVEKLETLLNETDDKNNLEALSHVFYNSMMDIQDIMLTDSYLSVEDLPFAYQSQFISKNGDKFMISVYPDFDIWRNLNTEKGERFLKDLHDVENSITGTPIFMKALYDAVGSEMAMTGLLLFGILLTILLIHFRSIKYALLAFLPLIFTLIFMLGTMTLLNIDYNMINFLSILLVIGIGLDDGVHILHHYKEGERDIQKLFSSIGRAILLTTITTVCGFGSLGFSSYRGIASLGIVLTIGVSFALILTVIILPIFLKDISNEEA